MEEHMQMVEDCMARESKLSEWEQGFISDMESWLGRGHSLTEKQADTLDKIWDRVTG